jgi:phytoene synthase
MQAQWETQLIKLAGDVQRPAHKPQPIFSYWAGDASLSSAYKTCDAITAAHSRSFFMASGLLPEEKRSAVRALYAFCRTVDDIVDESTDDQREAQLDFWRDVVKGIKDPGTDPVAQAWIDTRARYHIPAIYALQLIDGVSADLHKSRYQTFEELATYCYGVASTVGLMSMYIVGFHGKEAVQYAIKLGVALQLTNILRDVGEDYRNGRLYLPREELITHGIREEDIERGVVNESWRAFMRFQIDRARELYQEAWEGIRHLDRDGQMAIAAASDFYQGILEDIETHDYDVFSRRASLSAIGKIKRIPALWMKIRKIK